MSVTVFVSNLRLLGSFLLVYFGCSSFFSSCVRWKTKSNPSPWTWNWSLTKTFIVHIRHMRLSLLLGLIKMHILYGVQRNMDGPSAGKS